MTAANESWYQLREPVQFAGDLYYPAGATVFFNGNHMVRTGHYNGVPLYADTTVEPYSVVLVPVSRGLLQPYERRRTAIWPARPAAARRRSRCGHGHRDDGAVSGGVADRPAAAGRRDRRLHAGAGAGSRRRGRWHARQAASRQGEPGAVGTTGVVATSRRADAPPLVSMRRPESNDGVWISSAARSG